MVESSVSSINRSLQCWEIPVNIQVYSSTFFTHLEVLMIWLYSRVFVLDLWEEKDSKRICLKRKARAMQENPNPESRKFFCLLTAGILEILMEEFGILGFGIPNLRRGNQNLGLSCIPLYGAIRRCSHPRCSLIWAALLAMKMVLGEILIR